MESYDIVVLAGQSNAEGRGLGQGKYPFEANPRIMEYIDPYPFRMEKNAEGEDWLVMHEPPRFVLKENAEEKNQKGEALASLIPTFASSYLQKVLAPNRKLLIVKAAVDGTGFYWRDQWGKGERLTNRLFQVTEEALHLGTSSRLVAVLWHQGEHEVFERPWLKDEERKAFYHRCFLELIEEFRSRFGNIPWIAGEGTKRWEKDYPHESKAVWDAAKEVIKEVRNAAFVSSDGLLSNEEEIHNGDLLHFSRRSQEILGERYFASLELLLTNQK